MIKILSSVLGVGMLLLSYASGAIAQVCLSELEEAVEPISGRTIGILATSQERQVLLSWQADRPFIPASNQKILTTAIALHYLGADYRIATSLMTEVEPEDGEIKGNLWVVGRGDPTLTSTQGLKSLVQHLKSRGIHTIRGEIKFLNALRGRTISRGWEHTELHEYYAAPASAFTLDDNSHYWTIAPTKRGQPPRFTWDNPELVNGWQVENRAVTSPAHGSYTLYTVRPPRQKVLRIYGTIPENAQPELGGVTIPDQLAYFQERLQAELHSQGINLQGEKIRNLGTAKVDLAHVLSPPLGEILLNINKNSNNLHAEQLLRILGTRLHEIEPDTYLAGIKQIQQFFQEQGIPTAGLVVADGSGLSRYNLVTPRMLVTILQLMNAKPEFRHSLAVAGVDGTLKTRFINTIVAQRLQAKTGTITGVVTLSGYVPNQEFKEITFSIMINNPNQSRTEARRIIDAIVLLLAQVKRC